MLEMDHLLKYNRLCYLLKLWKSCGLSEYCVLDKDEFDDLQYLLTFYHINSIDSKRTIIIM